MKIVILDENKENSYTEDSILPSDFSEEIDWNQQWASFAENFYDGKAHIDLTRFKGKGSLLLLPGPGFGDLSHPTTDLMLQLMTKKIKDCSVLDIGSGSGILTLAALQLGATSAIGIDIDQEALSHASLNADLNNLTAIFTKTIPTTLKNHNNIILMNMILSEQIQVMQQHLLLNLLSSQWIVSGILSSQRNRYLEITKNWGWILQEEKCKDEWLGMVFIASKT